MPKQKIDEGLVRIIKKGTDLLIQEAVYTSKDSAGIACGEKHFDNTCDELALAIQSYLKKQGYRKVKEVYQIPFK